jgi:hypothetical protein
MRSVLELASLFRERAAECVKLAELATDPEARRDYCQLASCYLLLAQRALQHVEIWVAAVPFDVASNIKTS